MPIRLLVCAALLAGATSCVAARLILVEDSPNNLCRPDNCGYDEWRLEEAPDIRIVTTGYEDGKETTIYRLDKDGQYVVLLDVLPITRDTEGKSWWGYPATVRDLPIRLRKGGLYLYATYDHDQVDDGIHCHPEWQKRLPVMLFY